MRPAASLLATLALILAPAAIAGAQSAPFAPLPPAQPQTQAPAPPPVRNTSSTTDDGLPAWQQVAILGAALLLLAGIGWAIVHDAHRAAPVDDTPRPAGEAEPSARERARRQHRQRERAKAARRQRKRNRSR